MKSKLIGPIEKSRNLIAKLGTQSEAAKFANLMIDSYIAIDYDDMVHYWRNVLKHINHARPERIEGVVQC
jgi:hypothetical protein